MILPFFASHVLRAFRGYSCPTEAYRISSYSSACAGLVESPYVSMESKYCGHICSDSDLSQRIKDPSIETMHSMFDGYCPTFKIHPLGREVESLLLLNPSQQMCYHGGKLFGGYLTFLVDRILADCCQPQQAVTAQLDTSFVLAVPPTVPIRLRAWPIRTDGRKIFLQGSVQIPGDNQGEWLDAITANALFIIPRP